MSDGCEIHDCPNKRRVQKYGKILCEYHYRLIEKVKQKAGVGNKLEDLDWTNCQWCNHKVPRTITHHYTYEPEETVELCDRCHREVHESENHILKPSKYQKWQADLNLTVEDVKKLKECGKIRIDGLGRGEVESDYTGGWMFSFIQENGDSVLTDRRYHKRSEIEFLEKTPWSLDEGDN